MQTSIEPTTPPAASPAAPAEQPAAPAPMFTAEQVVERERAAAQKAHDAAMAEARRLFEGKQRATSQPPPAQQQPAQQPAAPAPAATSALDIARVVQFTTEAAQHGIPAKGIELLASRLDVERPTDVRAWVAEQADAYGWRKPTPTTTTATAPAATVTPAAANAQPVTGTAAPSNPTTVVTEDTPLINLTEQQRQDWIKQHGWMKYTERFTREAVRDQTKFRLPR